LKRAVGPIVEAMKIKTLAKIEGFESCNNDSDDGMFGCNNYHSHTKMPDDSNYFERDE
jgi:hypothetical protein